MIIMRTVMKLVLLLMVMIMVTETGHQGTCRAYSPTLESSRTFVPPVLRVPSSSNSENWFVFNYQPVTCCTASLRLLSYFKFTNVNPASGKLGTVSTVHGAIGCQTVPNWVFPTSCSSRVYCTQPSWRALCALCTPAVVLSWWLDSNAQCCLSLVSSRRVSSQVTWEGAINKCEQIKSTLCLVCFCAINALDLANISRLLRLLGSFVCCTKKVKSYDYPENI